VPEVDSSELDEQIAYQIWIPADHQAYDAHMNIVLSQVEESIHIVDVTEDGQPLPPRVRRSVIHRL
jgi:hypothetical protein